MSLDSNPITTASLAKPYHIKANQFERAYKDHLSGFSEWTEAEHAEDWLIFPQNIGPRVSIDETSLSNGELYTIVANKDGHARQGTIIALVKGAKAEDVIAVLERIDTTLRDKVTEITMDFSDTMEAIATACFPKAEIIVDRFHAQKLAYDAMQEIRMEEKRAAAKEEAKIKKAFKKRKEQQIKRRKKDKKDNRGRKPSRKNEAYVPFRYANGDTRVELLTRSRYLLMVSADKWTESQKQRAAILFENHPRIQQAYSLAHSLRVRYSKKHDDPILGYESIRLWIKEARDSAIEAFATVADTMEDKFCNVIKYFNDRATNAFAESLNSKIKDFRARLKGISDIKFFLYRVSLIFG